MSMFKPNTNLLVRPVRIEHRCSITYQETVIGGARKEIEESHSDFLTTLISGKIWKKRKTPGLINCELTRG